MKIKALLGFVLLISPWPLFAQDERANSSTTSPQNQLQQLTTQLQQSSGDQALREKIITLALTLNPKPATPDAAIMAEGAAEYAFKNAKSNVDYSKAAKQYEKALLLAPWLATDYFNCGVAHEKAGENKEAIRNFNLYLLAAPNADDAQAVKKRMGGLQYAAQESEDAASEQARAANERASAAALQTAVYKGLEGGVWEYKYDAPEQIRYHNRRTLEVHGHEIEEYWSDDLNARRRELHGTFNSRQFQIFVEGRTVGGISAPIHFTISDDGQTITTDNGEPGASYVYRRTN